MESIAKVCNLKKKVKQKLILNNINFDVKKGSILGLVGPNGAGKTTTMKCMLGLTNFQGSIQSISKSKIGALIENPGIYPFLSGYDNLKIYARNKNNIESITKKLSMESYINQKSSTYSLGMKQMLGIAIALVNNPEFVILDEPVNALDPEAILRVRNVIKEMNSRGITFLISSHILGELEKIISDILIMKAGKIVYEGKVDDADNSSNLLYIDTSNNALAVKVLRSVNINVTEDSNQLVIEKDNISTAKLINVLNDKNITVNSIENKRHNLEHFILDVLKKEDD